ncbi:MAG: hypothetical protein J6V44_05790 [Methanobrevibacter sp.]|nr:hypothetical protein [Methanobrevibacter sp.]MBO7692567.1 hypothetical protein [Methanobrevibacter sp.]
MKVIKHGNKYLGVKAGITRTFKCTNCGCVFEDESWSLFNGKTHKYYQRCPECLKEAEEAKIGGK